jgi:acyl-CoA reductase-like NAD-dependent aldehyde dehydrogenase
LLAGGKVPQDFGSGWFYEPTILVCPNQEVKTVQEEMFGPVLSALRFSDEEEAVACANNSRFGMGAGVFTRDVGRAIRVSKRIRSSIVWVTPTVLFRRDHLATR